MSEKRFIIVKSIENFYSLVDKEREDKEQILLLSLHKEQVCTVCDLLNEQQATINELQSIIDHIKCEEDCFDYDYCCETVCSLYKEIKHLKEENEQLRNSMKKLENVDLVIELKYSQGFEKYLADVRVVDNE